MNEQREKLSAIMDDFQPSAEDMETLDELVGDVNERYRMQRYQLIGDTLRNELPAQMRPGFAADVMAQIEQEPALSTSPQPAVQAQRSGTGFWSWLFRPAAGVAVAAAVAVVTISTLQVEPGNDGAEQIAHTDPAADARVQQLAQLPVISNNVRRVSGNSSPAASNDGMAWKIKRNEPDVQSKLNNYLINHNEYSQSVNGIIPQARVVGFDGNN